MRSTHKTRWIVWFKHAGAFIGWFRPYIRIDVEGTHPDAGICIQTLTKAIVVTPPKKSLGWLMTAALAWLASHYDGSSRWPTYARLNPFPFEHKFQGSLGRYLRFLEMAQSPALMFQELESVRKCSRLFRAEIYSPPQAQSRASETLARPTAKTSGMKLKDKNLVSQVHRSYFRGIRPGSQTELCDARPSVLVILFLYDHQINPIPRYLPGSLLLRPGV